MEAPSIEQIPVAARPAKPSWRLSPEADVGVVFITNCKEGKVQALSYSLAVRIFAPHFIQKT
jgi:hypothetical protein